MNVSRIRPIDWLAGLGGIVLLALLWLPWYDLADGTQNGWASFAFVDVWLALTALLAIAIPIVTAACETPSIPLAAAAAAEVATWPAFLLTLWRAIDQPSGPLDPTAMPWIAVLVVVLVGVLDWRTLRDERAPGLRPSPAPERMPKPS
jgi:hypothetical protein